MDAELLRPLLCCAPLPAGAPPHLAKQLLPPTRVNRSSSLQAGFYTASFSAASARATGSALYAHARCANGAGAQSQAVSAAFWADSTPPSPPVAMDGTIGSSGVSLQPLFSPASAAADAAFAAMIAAGACRGSAGGIANCSSNSTLLPFSSIPSSSAALLIRWRVVDPESGVAPGSVACLEFTAGSGAPLLHARP